jgi:hypothetical protein
VHLSLLPTFVVSLYVLACTIRVPLIMFVLIMMAGTMPLSGVESTASLMRSSFDRLFPQRSLRLNRNWRCGRERAATL